MFSSCDGGLICCWSTENGQLLQTLDNDATSENSSISEFSTDYCALNFTTELVANSHLLVGYNAYSKVITIWNKLSYELVAKITTTPIQEQENISNIGVNFFNT